MDRTKRAFDIARAVALQGHYLRPDIFDDCRLHDYKSIKTMCNEVKVRVVENEKLPSFCPEAAVLDVEGEYFIVLGDSLDTPFKRLVASAHELCHVLLGHLQLPNFAVMGYSQAMRVEDNDLQVSFCEDMELEAETLAMQLILPDSYLHDVVEKTIYIPASLTARKLGLALDWMRARIQLYRGIHGYARSIQLLRMRPRDPFELVDTNKWFDLEPRGVESLLGYIDRRLAARLL